MKKRIGSLLIASALCLGLLSTAALADETTAPCTDGQHTWYYGNPDCTTCGAPLRAAVSWDHSSVGGRYTDVKNAFEDAKLHTDSGVVPYTITLLADAELDGSVEIGHSKIQLYLDGYTLTLVPGGDAQSAIRVLPGGYLWIREGNTSGGKIVVDPAESDADWVAGIELAGGKATFEGGELSVADPYSGSAECSVVRMTGSAGNVFDMDWASVLSGEGSYAVIADGSGPEVSLDIKGEKTYGRIKVTKNYPGSVRLYQGTFAGLELEPDGKYQSLDQLLMSYRDYQDVDSGAVLDGSGLTLENVRIVHTHVYDEEGRCKSGDFAYAHARIVNSPNAEVNRFYDEFEEALTIARLPENDGCTLELWGENPNANEKNGGVGYLINDGKFTLDLRDRGMDHDFVNDAPEYVLKHTGGELTLTASGGYELGYLRAYGPVKALGVAGGHVRIDDGRYLWIWHKDYDNDDNSGCIVELRSGVLEISGGTFSSEFKDETPDEDTKDPRIRVIGGSLTVTGEPVFDAAMEVASDFTANGGKIALSGGTFSKITSKDAALTVAGMLAPGYVCQNADGARLSLADLRAAELEDFSVVKCEHALSESGGKSVCPYCEQELTVSAAQLPGGQPRYYTDLASALEDSADLSGQVLLTMLADAEITEQVRVTGGSYTLDLNGRPLTCKVSGGDIADAGAILVTGGELTVKDGTGSGKVSVSVDGGVGLCAVGGTLTVESGTYTADGASSIAIALGGGAGETGTNGAVILTGGTIQPNGAGSEGVRAGNGGKALTVSGPVTVKSTANMAYGVRIASGYQGTVSISAGTFSKIDIEAEGMTAADLLAEGFQFRNSSKRWITDLSVTQLIKTSAAAIPIRLGRMESSYDVVYKADGKNVITLEVFAPEGGAGFEEYDLFLEFECEDENGNRGNGSTGWADIDPDKQRAVFTLDGFLRDKAVGTYRFTVTSVKYHSSQTDAYTLPGESFIVNVRRSGTEAAVETGISDSWFDKKDTFIYGQRITVRAMFDATGELPAMLAMTPPGEDQCAVFNAAGEQISEAEDAQSSGTWWLDIPGTALDVGTHALTVKYVGGRNQTGMSVPFTVTVEPRPITALVQDEAPLVYNGTPLTRAVASVEADGLALTAADYSVSGNTRTAAGTYELTVTGRGNYTGTLTGSYTIAKASAPAAQDGVVTVANQREAVYTADLTALLPGLADPMEYGAVTYALGAAQIDGSYYTPDTAAVENGVLKLPIHAVDSSTENEIGTVTVTVSSANVDDFDLTLKVHTTNKIVPDGTPTLSRTTLTYGEKLSAITLSGVMKDGDTAVRGTFAWTEPNTMPEAGVCQAAWRFTPADGDTYLEVLGTAEVTVRKAAPSGAPKYTLIKAGGKTLADAALDVNEAWPAGTVQWVDGNGNALPADTEVKANTAYRWVFTPDDTANYAQVSGSVRLYSAGSSGGGGGDGGASAPTYPVSAPGGASGGTSVGASDGGSISVSTKNAEAGDTVTITVSPETGYRLEKLTVVDKNGKEISVTEKNGKYTFTMPASQVEIKPVFEKIPAEMVFPDVPSNAYYADAVKWAAENGVTGGTKNGGFAPSDACTRAQIVTFLWRAAGCPEPTGTHAAPGDVSEEAYYAKAVLWALENGITNGRSNGGFDPGAPCTRAQAVTFLARALNADGNGSAAFHDVPADSYYAAAVAWAVENGVTNGTKDGGFSPNAACTRAQIVTFLYRAYQSR